VTEISVWLRRGATTVAVGRVALGMTALAWPAVPARPWVGASADNVAATVFGRALGARDVALGLGALAALNWPRPPAAALNWPRPPAAALSGIGDGRSADNSKKRCDGSARAWVAAGALSDAFDVLASVASWRELPRLTRWLVAASAGGAAIVGAAGALTAQPETGPDA
jgi:hypothetical protein